MSISKERKWTITKWRFLVEVLIIGAAVGMAFSMKLSQPAIAFLAAGVADMAANVVTYTAGNVIQKGIIAKNFRKELQDGGE